MKTSAGGRGLGARLLFAQTLVAVVSAATLWLVAAAVGPAIFRGHLGRATQVSTETRRHVEEAFRSASAVSIGVALAASLAAALGISLYVTRRIARPVVHLAAATRAVADGQYAVQVSPPAIGAEFATLAASFNVMAQRLARVESTRRRLLADLAHEMRTPVATLEAYLDGLEDGIVSVDPTSVGVLRSQTGRLARLAEDMTAVSLAEEGRIDVSIRELQASDVVRSAVAAAQDRYRAKGVSIEADVAPGMPTIAADPDRLGQVLGNLLDNALRHTPTGGTVTVRAYPQPASSGIGIDVADTGDGIPADQLPHVFERFYRVDKARDRAHGGSGIGLAIAKALVEAQHGRISAASGGADRGSTFTITLPGGLPQDQSPVCVIQ